MKRMSKKFLAACAGLVGLLGSGKSFAMDSCTCVKNLKILYDRNTPEELELKNKYESRCKLIKESYESETGNKCDKILGWGLGGVVYTIKNQPNRLVKFAYAEGGQAGHLDSWAYDGYGYYKSSEYRFCSTGETKKDFGKHVCKVYAYGCNTSTENHGFTLWYEMENIKGEDLNEYVAKHRCSCQQVIDWSLQILDGLQNLYNDGWLHNDVKLDNIRIREKSGEAVLVDFGKLVDIQSHKANWDTEWWKQLYGGVFGSGADVYKKADHDNAHNTPTVISQLCDYVPEREKIKYNSIYNELAAAGGTWSNNIDDMKKKLTDLKNKL